jgi:hypothetical protein
MKYSMKLMMVVGITISLLSGCGVKYIENGFGGGCAQHHTAKLNHSHISNHEPVNQSNSTVFKENEVSDSRLIFTKETALNINGSAPKLTLVQKFKLIQNVKQHIKNLPKSKSSDLGKREIKSSQAVKIQKNDFDTSVEGLLKLVLIIVLALLILGLINMLVGYSWLNLLVLLLLIYLIWIYLF